MRRLWRVVLADAANADFVAILEWTAEQFSDRQADASAEILMSAVDALEEGPDIVGVRRLSGDEGLLVLHAARHGRRARHLLVFRTEDGSAPALTILRILHDSMDIARHLPEVPEE